MIATELYSSSLGYFSVPPDSKQPLRGRGTQEEHVLVKVGQAQPVFWILALSSASQGQDSPGRSRTAPSARPPRCWQWDRMPKAPARQV